MIKENALVLLVQLTRVLYNASWHHLKSTLLWLIVEYTQSKKQWIRKEKMREVDMSFLLSQLDNIPFQSTRLYLKPQRIFNSLPGT